MIWSSPEWMPQSHSFPVDKTLGDFTLGGNGAGQSQPHKPALISARDGTSWTISQLTARVNCLARRLSCLLGWSPDTPKTPWGKVVAVFAVNSVDYLTVCWAIHRLGGICLLLHPTSTAEVISDHFARVQCRACFVSMSLVPVLEQARESGASIPKGTYLMGPMEAYSDDFVGHVKYPLLEHVLKYSEQKEPWSAPPRSSQVAFLCPTSGTSGAQKLAKMTHANVIANVIITVAVDNVAKKGHTEVGLEMLPLSHIYGILIAHAMLWRGDTMVLHGTFDMQNVLQSIVKYRIQCLYLIPSVVAALVANKVLFKAFDFSSVTSIATGGGSLSSDLAAKFKLIQPTWKILAGFGTTESGGLATFTGADDVFLGSSGSLLPTVQAKLVTEDGTPIGDYDSPGEILLKSHSVIPGYFDGESHDLMTPDGWLRTGDVGLFRKGPRGYDHLFVVDRLKDMLKVKGIQVAPADIEQTLLRHSHVAEAAVIGEPHELSGERAKAFVVCERPDMTQVETAELQGSLRDMVEVSHPETHWLGNRIVFVQQLPRTSGGKILKRLLKTGDYHVI